MGDKSEITHDVRIGGQCNLKGAVLDDNNRPVVGATVGNTCTAINYIAALVTGEDGTYCFSVDVPSGPNSPSFTFTLNVTPAQSGYSVDPSSQEVTVASTDGGTDKQLGNFLVSS